MSELWKRWEGQVIDHKYQLREFRGSTDHSAVFRAEFHAPELRSVAVKFLAADLPDADQVLANWTRAQQLKHENLLSIYNAGRCRIEDMDLIYVATEYADENLAEILPHRALTGDEAGEVLATVVGVLAYLHSQKLTHGHIKPSNILALGDKLKLSSDTVEPLREAREMRRKRDAYDAPEIPATPFNPAADMWSLGVTLVETLTQQPAFLPFNENAEPVIAPTVREPFKEIAANLLRRDPNARWNALDVAAKLNPEAVEKLRATVLGGSAVEKQPAPAVANPPTIATSAAASVSAVAVATPIAQPVDTPVPAMAASSAAAAKSAPVPAPAAPVVSPLAVPLSKEPPLGKQPTVKTISPRPPMPPPPPAARPEKPLSRHPIVLPNYVVPVLAGVLVIAAFIALPKILRRETRQPVSASTQSSATLPMTGQNSAHAPVSSAPSQPPQAAPKTPANSAEPSISVPSTQTSSAANGSAPAVLRNPGSGRAAAPRSASGSDRGEVLDQVMPRPSSEALASIDGTVRVVVRVKVDPSGNVSQALLEKPGPSKYFAQKSLEAAHGWVFLSPGVDGHSEPSEWLIRFDFTHSGANAYPQQVRP